MLWEGVAEESPGLQSARASRGPRCAQIDSGSRLEVRCLGVSMLLLLTSAQSHALSLSFPRLAHYSQLHDVQTLAMLCSVFEAQSRLQGCPNSSGPFPQRASNLASHSRYV